MNRKTLIIAEKPSVARDIARVLGVSTGHQGLITGRGYTVTWCIGHLVELAAPVDYKESWKSWNLEELPMLPGSFKLRGKENTSAQLEVVASLLQDTSTYADVINACDAGREGELIFRYVYELAGSILPIRRLWIASLTNEAIKQGMNTLQKGEAFDRLYQSARARSQADWLVGLNATRLLTLLARQSPQADDVPLLSVGRVQTPTLALVVRRDKARAAFKPVTRFGVEAEFCTLKGEHYKGKFIETEQSKTPYLFATKEEAHSLARGRDAKAQAQILGCDTSESTRQPPMFFDLTSLQREANTRLGFSAQHTLDLAQSLYETHKLLTYPRTDSRYITPDLSRTLIGRIKALYEDETLGEAAHLLVASEVDVVGLSKRLVDAKKVTDHHAILPTKQPVVRSALKKDEYELYVLVARRMMAALAKPARMARTALVTAWQEAYFLTQGTALLEPGWMMFEKTSLSEEQDTLPSHLSKGDRVAAISAKDYESTTRAPAALTEASLLQAMETAGKSLESEELADALTSSGGLGTPATRAGCIETLLARGYLTRKGRTLSATALGCSLVEALDAFPNLTDAGLTAKWEQGLEAITEGELSEESFMLRVVELVKAFTGHFMRNPPKLALPEKQSLGACPSCGQRVFLGKRQMYCSVLRTGSCDFCVGRKVAGKTLTVSQLSTLLNTRHTRELKGFKSKAGKSFAAALELTETDRGWRIGFVFDKTATSEKEARS